MKRAGGIGGLVVLAVAIFVVPAHGAEKWHTVIHGDSASGIAKRYYGDYDLTELLLGFNDRTDAHIRPGERLRVPYCPVHQVKPGDTGSTLAQRYLGRPSAWPTIAEMNGLSPGDPLRVGQKIVMPVVLPHTLARGESLAVLAERYYADPSRGRLLQAFNRIDDPRELAVGRVIEVPLDTLRLAERVAAPKPEPKRSRRAEAKRPVEPEPVKAPPEPADQEVVAEKPAPAPDEVVPETPAWFIEGLAEAEGSYAAGDFDLAEEQVTALLERVDEVPASDDRASLWRLAAFVHVALDREDAACANFGMLQSVESPVELDPDLVSPKIRAALAACYSDGSS